MRKTMIWWPLAACTSVVGCGGAGAPATAPTPPVVEPTAAAEPAAPSEPSAVDEVAGRLLGTMSSWRQSLEQPAYFDVTLKHCELDVEGAAEGTRHLLLRQAISVAAERPYRVRVMRLAPGETGGVVATTFEPADPAPLLALCPAGGETPAEPPTVDLAALGEERCTTALSKEGEVYVGATPRGVCKSEHRGASYVTTEVRIGDGWMESWDRGFDASDQQVWGATDGAYRFERTDPAGHDPQVVELASFFVGKSDNRAQAEGAKDVMPVDYQMCAIDAEHDGVSPETVLLFVRQVIALPQGEHVRERVYAFSRKDEGVIGFTSLGLVEGATPGEVCAQDQAARYAFDPALVDWSTGCPMEFRPAGDSTYEGKTLPGGCPSTFRGAQRLEISETVKPGAFDVWERWYDAAGKQVAGSKSGPYEYRRKKP